MIEGYEDGYEEDMMAEESTGRMEHELRSREETPIPEGWTEGGEVIEISFDDRVGIEAIALIFGWDGVGGYDRASEYMRLMAESTPFTLPDMRDQNRLPDELPGSDILADRREIE